ncbi:helix-turn-helix domain-containing protein [Chroococcidiopsidales cyanobacterium LEGE 13417]|nr:helix-turn-helix domain-containing protein [Chroococcidiopsidales cyanobacterium LEGE 13417]
MPVKKSLAVSQRQISNLIRELRLETGLTQEEFAAELGVTCSSVNRWENQRGKPSKLALKLIEQMLQRMGDRGKDLLQKYLVQ